MQLSRFENFRIAGMATAVPANSVAVEHFAAQFGEENMRKFSQMTGVREVRRAHPAQTASDLAFLAAEDLLARTAVERERISLLLFVTQKPDHRVPATAYVLQKRLHLESHCICLDLNLACSGYIYGLHTALSLLHRSPGCAGALVLTGDTSMRTLSPMDRTVFPLFGDAGTATLLLPDEAAPSIGTGLWSDGSRFKSIITPSGAYRNPDGELERREWGDGIVRSDYDTHMKGKEIFEFSITDVPAFVGRYLADIGKTPDDFDTFAIHQANLFILKQLARKNRLPSDKLPVSIDRFGNTSSNSVPLVLCDHFGSVVDRALRVFGCGFGGGLSLGCADFEMEAAQIFPVLESDDFYQS
jgi:3-oxoacyl-[acyl-carrier-protein] synthase III